MELALTVESILPESITKKYFKDTIVVVHVNGDKNSIVKTRKEPKPNQSTFNPILVSCTPMQPTVNATSSKIQKRKLLNYL